MEKTATGQILNKQQFLFEKPRHREAMRNLPMPEKVRIVVELQKISAPVLRARGETPFIWKI